MAVERSLRVHVSADSLERSTSGAITGVVYLFDGTTAFPSADWNDFVVVVVGWWLVELSLPFVGTAVCSFMDDDWEFSVAPSTGSLWRVQC